MGYKGMIVRDAADIGNIIRETRTQLKLSQKELAEKAGIHQPKISEIERGKPTAHLAIVLRILQALELDIDLGNFSKDTASPKILVDEPDYDEDIDLDAIADTGLKR